MTLRPKRAWESGCTGEEWDGGSGAQDEWTLRTSELKVNPGPSGQPSCLSGVETKTQKAEGPYLGSHSRQELAEGLEPGGQRECLLFLWDRGPEWEDWSWAAPCPGLQAGSR